MNLEIVLHEVAGLPVVDVHRWTQPVVVLRLRRGQAYQEAREPVGHTSGGVCDQPARVAAVVGGPVERRVIYHIEAAFDRMPPVEPCECIAEGIEILVERPEGVAPARSEVGVPSTPEGDPYVSKGVACGLADHREVSVNVAAIKAYALEERLGRSVTPAEEILEVESTPRLVDKVVREDMRVRERERVVGLLILRQ